METINTVSPSTTPPTQQQPPSTTETEKVKSFEGSITIQFPETQQTVEYTPKELLRGDNKWSYPYPNIPPNISLSELSDLMGAEFLKELIIDGITDRCQMKWRNACKDKNDIKEITDKFTASFFEMKRDTGLTSIKVGKQWQEKIKEYSKAKRLKADPMLLASLESEFKALQLLQTKLMMEEMKAGIKVIDTDEKE